MHRDNAKVVTGVCYDCGGLIFELLNFREGYFTLTHEPAIVFYVLFVRFIILIKLF